MYNFFKTYAIFQGNFRVKTLLLETCEGAEDKYHFETNIHVETDSLNRIVAKGYVVVPKDSRIQKVIISQ